jgi:hypothetical protein
MSQLQWLRETRAERPCHFRSKAPQAFSRWDQSSCQSHSSTYNGPSEGKPERRNKGWNRPLFLLALQAIHLAQTSRDLGMRSFRGVAAVTNMWDDVQLHLVKDCPDGCRFFHGTSLAGYHDAWEGRSNLILHGSGSLMRKTRFQSILPLEFPPRSKLRRCFAWRCRVTTKTKTSQSRVWLVISKPMAENHQ